MPSPFPLNLVSRLKKVITTANGLRARQRGHFVLAVMAIVYLSGLDAARANSAEQASSTATTATSQDAAAVSGNVTATEPMSAKTEEMLLKKSLQDLKDYNLSEAITNLGRLKDGFPDNDDYLLLYRTAIRKKNSIDPDSQVWYSYTRALDKKEEDEKNSLLNGVKETMTVPAHGHIGELKRETWLVLTTGKYKSANQGRRAHKVSK
jgi:hypothetical protein